MLHMMSNLMVGFFLAAASAPANAYWRMTCGLVQTGRVDPIVFPGVVSPHVHRIMGANTLSASSNFSSLQRSRCTSCEVQKDRSAYWTPQLYYQYDNGSFVEVPGGGIAAYYLGRGDVTDDLVPFPPGLRMVSGDPFARALNTTATTWDGSTLIADRTNFACLSDSPLPETQNLTYTNCKDGLRAQVKFPSCWDGIHLYKEDQSHVAYLSALDNGKCPPTYPVHFMTIFIETWYQVDNVPGKGNGGPGRFVFANGDPTGYGFHADFMNGWDNQTLYNAIRQCAVNDSITGIQSPDQCPAFQDMLDPYPDQNCGPQSPLVDEQVGGWLDKLPGCNAVQVGPAAATPVTTCSDTASLNGYAPPTHTPMYEPVPDESILTDANGHTWIYAGCAKEPTNGRALTASDFSAENMTIETCLSYCGSVMMPMAGVEYGTQCFCGQTLSQTEFLNTSTCEQTPKMECQGNYTEWCGGNAFLNVWNSTT
jgi:hypothetical protein